MFESAMFMELVEMFCRRCYEQGPADPLEKTTIIDGGDARELTEDEEELATQFVLLATQAHRQGIDLGRIALSKLQRKSR